MFPHFSALTWRILAFNTLALLILTGGVIGGFTAFPGAAVVVWTGLHRMSKHEARSIVQPYILVLQVISLALLAIQHPQTFNPAFWTLAAVTVPVVLPGILLGVRLYKSLSDINFRRIAFMMLGVSGFGLLMKAVTALSLFAQIAKAVHTAEAGPVPSTQSRQCSRAGPRASVRGASQGA